RYALSATLWNVESIDARKATTINWPIDSQPPIAATGIEPRQTARPRSATIITGRRRSRSTHAPATRPIATPPTISNARMAATSPGPAPRTRIAANGNAARVTSEPKIETVAALKTRTKTGLRQIEPVMPVQDTDATGTDGGDSELGRAAGRALHFRRLGESELAPHPFRSVPVAVRTGHLTPRSPSSTVFDSLSERLRKTLDNLTGRGRVTEADGHAAMREIRLSLLEADVNFKVVKDFVARVREKAVGAEVLGSLNAGQQVVKIVHDELVELLGAGDRTFHLQGNPAVIALVGLQGSGKTTSAAKLAKYLVKQGRRPLLVAADPYRPAAADQLETLGRSLDVPVHRAPQGTPVVDIAKGGLDAGRRLRRQRR